MSILSVRPARCAISLPLLALGLAVGCNTQPQIVEAPPPPVTVSQPVVRKLVPHDDYEGRIAAAYRVEVRSRVRGHLTKVNFEAGQMVKEGQLLYEIDPRSYAATLQGAKAVAKAADASLKLAQAEFKREEALASRQATSAREVEVWAAKAAVASGEVLKSKALVEEAQLNVDFTKIAAPISGKISRTQVDVGNLVNAGGGETLLTTIVSIDPMYVNFSVDERSLLRYRELYSKERKEKTTVKDLKIPVFVALEGQTGYPAKGLIDFVDNRVNSGTGTIAVRGVLSNDDRLLEDGMRARVRVPVGEPQEKILITERALGTDQGNKYVYVVNDKNKVERRDVTVGRVEEGLQVILDGLGPQDWIIVNGIQRVRDGLEVRPAKAEMPGAKK
jgi:RND family efflux transporter MFP subunit